MSDGAAQVCVVLALILVVLMVTRPNDQPRETWRNATEVFLVFLMAAILLRDTSIGWTVVAFVAAVVLFVLDEYNKVENWKEAQEAKRAPPEAPPPPPEPPKEPTTKEKVEALLEKVSQEKQNKQ